MIKKILIVSIIIYVFFTDILVSLLQFPFLKTLISLITIFSFLTYYIIYLKKLRETHFVYISLFFLIIYFFVWWPTLGYLNLFFTIVFGWSLAQDYKFSLKIFKLIFLIQLIIVIYEVLFSTVLFESLTSGVINENIYDYGKNFEDFDTTGFRPKGLFPGTLVATSFIIYLVMIFRNNIKILTALFLLALLTNGRLALIISGFTLLFKLYKSFDLIFLKEKLSSFQKFIFFITPFFLLILVLALFLPSEMISNFLNSFNIETSSNAGRIFAYFQALDLFIEYDFTQKLFGDPENIVFDIYGREIASESGLLSMALDIGLIGLLFYMYHFIKIWISEKASVFNLKSKNIGIKYVMLFTFLAFIQYEHINGNVRGTLFWFIIISQYILVMNKKYRDPYTLN